MINSGNVVSIGAVLVAMASKCTAWTFQAKREFRLCWRVAADRAAKRARAVLSTPTNSPHVRRRRGRAVRLRSCGTNRSSFFDPRRRGLRGEQFRKEHECKNESECLHWIAPLHVMVMPTAQRRWKPFQ